MNLIRRELLNGLFVLLLSTLLSAAFAAFQVRFDVQLWVWIVIGIGITLGFYVVFELRLGFMSSSEDREKASEESTRRREEEWLKQVGNPVRFELGAGGGSGMDVLVEVVKAIRPGSDFTIQHNLMMSRTVVGEFQETLGE
jgi:hypothetical protein